MRTNHEASHRNVIQTDQPASPFLLQQASKAAIPTTGGRHLMKQGDQAAADILQSTATRWLIDISGNAPNTPLLLLGTPHILHAQAGWCQRCGLSQKSPQQVMPAA